MGTAKRVINQGDEFEVKRDGVTNRFRRESDDSAPTFECERIRVTHLASAPYALSEPYTFGTEPEWFAQRGLVASVPVATPAKPAKAPRCRHDFSDGDVCSKCDALRRGAA